MKVPFGSFKFTSIFYVEYLGQKSSKQSATFFIFAIIFCVLSFYLGGLMVSCCRGLGQDMQDMVII